MAAMFAFGRNCLFVFRLTPLLQVMMLLWDLMKRELISTISRLSNEEQVITRGLLPLEARP